MSNLMDTRVLIVDDVHINRMILSSLLASHGIASDLAEGGQECIDMYKKNKYDLILLDHRMPEIDGVDTLLKLKEIFLKTGREIPVVCHTTEDAAKNINLYKAAGFADVLIKPIQPKILSEILMTYLPGGSELEKKLHTDEEKQIDEKMEGLPDFIKSVGEIDARSGLVNCDTVEDYMEALEIYYSSVESKADEIEKLVDDANFSVYTIKLHSLKSMSRLIGAAELGDMAYELELAGKNQDIDTICKKTPALLVRYRALKEELEPIVSLLYKSDDEALDEVPDDMLSDAYGSILEFVKSYDGESIEMVLDTLAGYTIPPGEIKKVDSIKKAYAQSDWERLREILN